MQQEQHALLWLQPFDFDALGEPTGDLGTGGEQEVSLASCGQEVPQQREVIGVIEDEQPPASAPGTSA